MSEEKGTRKKKRIKFRKKIDNKKRRRLKKWKEVGIIFLSHLLLYFQ